MTFQKRNIQPQFAFSDTEPWGRCFTHFAHMCSHSENTRYLYTSILTAFLSHPAKMPDMYTQEDTLNFLYAPLQSGKLPSVATTNQRLAAVSAFYAFAASYSITGDDNRPTPLLKTVPPTLGLKGGKPSIKYRALSSKELTQLFAAIPTDSVRGLRARAAFAFFWWSARRRMEVCRLLWRDLEKVTIIDENEQMREITVYHFRGKGKSNEDDVAELPGPAYESLLRYLSVSGRLDGMQPSDPLFTRLHERRDVDQHQPLSDESLARELKVWAGRAGIEPSRVSLHCLRHSAARMRVEQGEKLLDVQRLLRHSSLDMTFRYVSRLVTPTDTGAARLAQHYSRFS